MSIIAIKGIPDKWSLAGMVKKYSKVINGQFEPLNFMPAAKFDEKICYIRLSERLDPVRVVEKINSRATKGIKPIAFIPEHVPDLPLARKKSQLFGRTLRGFKLMRLHEVVLVAHQEILLELQTKFPGLYNLSNKTGHKLLDQLSRIIYERLKVLMDASNEYNESSFLLSQAYRRVHPHFGDFQMILDTLHGLQDASGAPRMQLAENDLAQYSPQACDRNQIPMANIMKQSHRFSCKVSEAIKIHIKQLDTKDATVTEEDIARKRVREEMKKMLPLIPSILGQVVKKHFFPVGLPFYRIRIYGEPFLPSKQMMQPFVQRYNPSKSRVSRSRRMFNLLKFFVPGNKFTELIAMNGTILNGAKLIIRGEMPYYRISKELKKEILKKYGGGEDFEIPEEEGDDQDDDMEM